MSQRHLTEIELTEYADGELAPAKVSRVEDHLRRCDPCAEALAGCRSVVAALGRMAPAAAPADVRHRVAAALEARPLPALDCRRAAPLLQERVDRCLSPFLSVPLEQHLRACAGCRAELTSLSRAARLVRSLTPVPVPERVRSAVLATQGQRVAGPAWSLRLRPALATAGFIAVGAVALLLRPGVQPPAPSRETSVAQRPIAGEVKPPEAPVAAERAEPVAEGEPASVAVATIAEDALGEVGGEAAAYRPPARRAGRASPAPAPASIEAPARAAPVMLAAASPMAVPAAVHALKAVASSAESYREARRGMDLAAERFATLQSEEMLDRLPDLASSGSVSVGTPGGERGAGAAAGEREGTGGPARNSAFIPGGSDLGSPPVV